MTYDPWLALTKAERREQQMRTRHKTKLAKLQASHAAEREALRLDLMHLETDIRAGRPRDKLIDAVRLIRSKTPLTPSNKRP